MSDQSVHRKTKVQVHSKTQAMISPQSWKTLALENSGTSYLNSILYSTSSPKRLTPGTEVVAPTVEVGSGKASSL